MKELQKRLEEDLALMVRRLGRTGPVGAVQALDAESGADAACADETDGMVLGQERELRFGTRERLVTRVNQIVAALARLNRGEYGACVECGQRIAAARLRALPEVERCVTCQDRIERAGMDRDGRERFLTRLDALRSLTDTGPGRLSRGPRRVSLTSTPGGSHVC